MPRTKAATSRSGRLSPSMAARTATTPSVAIRVPSATNRMRRRSNRSALTPASSTTSTDGNAPAMETPATRSGSVVRRTAMTAMATRTTPSARFDDADATHSRRKSAGRSPNVSTRRRQATLLIDLERALRDLDPDASILDLDVVDRERIFGRRIEGLAVGDVESRQVQRAGQRPGGEEALVELEVLVRAGALHRVELVAVPDHQDRV